jgi:hypothetical protein
MSVVYGTSESWRDLSKANARNDLIGSQLTYAIDFNKKLSYPGSGSTVSDLQGTISGTFTNGPIFNNSYGVKYLTFDGSNDYIAINDFTLPTVCSVYFSIRTTSAGQIGLFSHWSGGPVNVGYGLSGGKLQYIQYDSQWNYYSSTGASVNTGKWVHLAFIRTSSTNMLMYVDGVLDYTLNVSSPRSLGGGNMGSIGMYWGWGNFNGDFGAMQVYGNAAHSAAEVSRQYQISHSKRYGT